MWRIHEPARKRDVNDRRPLRYSDAARMLHDVTMARRSDWQRLERSSPRDSLVNSSRIGVT